MDSEDINFAVCSSEMSCLMEALQDKRVRLQPECKKRLQDRIDMWSYAAKVSQTHTFLQVLHDVQLLLDIEMSRFIVILF